MHWVSQTLSPVPEGGRTASHVESYFQCFAWQVSSRTLGSPPFASDLGHLEGDQPYLGDFLTMLLNRLQVMGWDPPSRNGFKLGDRNGGILRKKQLLGE